jgi:nucleotide-binding universal stress UspA family protein
MPIQRILVPVDYSPCSRAALHFALELASKFEATLDVVHVWDRPTYVTSALVATKGGVPMAALLEQVETTAKHDLSEFLSSAGAPAELINRGRLLSGDPASTLLQELKREEHDLVVVGTHGRTGMTHLLMGSVAEKLARLATVPVVTVPDENARRLRR